MIFWTICSINNLILLMRKLRFRKVRIASKQVSDSNKAGLLINAQTFNTMLDYKVSTRKKRVTDNS